MNLKTTYMGLELKNPLIASSSPLSQSVDNIKRMEDAGAAAVVMFSLFEEQLKQERGIAPLADFPARSDYDTNSDQYLEIVRGASEHCEIPIIASLNGTTDDGWVDFARQLETAGAQGLELNVYYIPANPDLSGNKVEETYLDILQAFKGSIAMPVAMKLSPYFSSLANMAQQLDEAGADALVLFNRFYEPDFDLEKGDVRPTLNLSSPYEIRLPLMWIAILYGKVSASLGATRGVHSGAEIVKYIMAGADAVMATSAILANGIDFIRQLLDETSRWLEHHGHDSVESIKGSMSQQAVSDPTAFERANYIRTLGSYQSPYFS